jgi:hypothetical protein
MIDAEQSYLQPAIDHFARLMQQVWCFGFGFCINLLTFGTNQRFNKNARVVFNTYQAYLTSAKQHIAADLERYGYDIQNCMFHCCCCS